MTESPPGPQVVLIESRGRFLVGEPFFERGRRHTLERGRDARPGRLALVAPGRGGRRSKVTRLLGAPDNARDVLEALMLDRGLMRGFPPGVEKAAQAAVDAVAQTPGRRDLRGLDTFTIDPPTAQDFDDAISCEPIGERAWRIWVHIADVSAYVRPGSVVDREAYRRGTSVYVPGLVEPMLPQVLSNGACSLVPGQDRNAVTVEFELHGDAVRRPAFHRSLIRSDRRYDYDEVDALFASGEPLPRALQAARAAAAELQSKRVTTHALELDTGEPEYTFDSAGNLDSVHRSVQTESHLLIEHLMIAANEQVAKHLDEARIPALFRIHERPDGEAIEALLGKLASLDVATPPAPERMSSTQAAEVAAEASRLVVEHYRRSGHGRVGLTSLVLRALKQARYWPRDTGHAGLGLEHYCHFTSPIRRYPDLVCHRALLASLGAGEDRPPSGALSEAADWTSERERAAALIERDADDIARCFLLERLLFEGGFEQEFEGEVSGVIAAGAFVAFGDGFEGMAPVRRMRGDHFELNEQGTILFGTRRGSSVRIGDPVTVKVARVDVPRGRVDLDMIASA